MVGVDWFGVVGFGLEVVYVQLGVSFALLDLLCHGYIGQVGFGLVDIALQIAYSGWRGLVGVKVDCLQET